MLLAVLLLAAVTAAGWAAVVTKPGFAGPSKVVSTARHGYPSGTGP